MYSILEIDFHSSRVVFAVLKDHDETRCNLLYAWRAALFHLVSTSSQVLFSEDSWNEKIHDERSSRVCMINTTPGVKRCSLCRCPTSECAQFFGGLGQRQAWGPFNYTLSIYTHPSFSLGTGAEQSIMKGLRYRASNIFLFFFLYICVLTLIIIICNIHSPLAPISLCQHMSVQAVEVFN